MINKEVLKQIASKGILIELYDDEDDVDWFSVGRIDSLSASACTIQCINDMGLPSGFRTVRLTAIRKIQWDTRYLAQVLLLTKTGKWWERQSSARVKSSSAGNLVLEELRIARAEGAFVSLGFGSEESESAGLVEAIAGNNVVIREISSDGECDGFTLVPLERIAWIHRGGISGNKYLTFHENRVGLYKEHKMSLALTPRQKKRSKG